MRPLMAITLQLKYSVDPSDAVPSMLVLQASMVRYGDPYNIAVQPYLYGNGAQPYLISKNILERDL